MTKIVLIYNLCLIISNSINIYDQCYAMIYRYVFCMDLKH